MLLFLFWPRTFTSSVPMSSSSHFTTGLEPKTNDDQNKQFTSQPANSKALFIACPRTSPLGLNMSEKPTEALFLCRYENSIKHRTRLGHVWQVDYFSKHFLFTAIKCAIVSAFESMTNADKHMHIYAYAGLHTQL